MAASWFRRLGLQRRIMLYVAIGLALMFAIGAYLGLLAIRQATSLVYQERLATAFTTAAALDHELQELAHEAGSMRERLLRELSLQEREELGRDLRALVSPPSGRSLVHAEGLRIVEQAGDAWSLLPGPGDALRVPSAISQLDTLQEPTLVFLPEAPSSSYFGTLLVPVRDDAGRLRWTIILDIVALNQDEPYLSPPQVTTRPQAVSPKPSNAYGLEVLGPQGRVALARGGKTPPGKSSPHWSLLLQYTPQMQPLVFLHEPGKGQKFAPHVVAAVPLASGPYVVLLQQGEDVALALPLRLRQRLALFAGLGFVATMLVTWVTTRHVVRPTERLTVAARRIAEGKVEEPIRVEAQDEIGALAESLEVMRQRLQAWGSELERQVRERTSELEARNRELGRLYETLQKKEEQLHALLGKVLGAQEDERRRVSRELHDTIGQALSAISMGLERLERVTPDQRPQFQERVVTLEGLAKETLRDLRRLTIALRPAALDDLGLVPAIRRYAELYLGDARVDFAVQEEGLDARPDPWLETVIYRVIQEAINNVARHSKATQVRIRLRSTDGSVVVTVEDNGQGFDPTATMAKRGVGLQGMGERASLAGGTLTVHSQPGAGTTVRLQIPREDTAGARDDAEIKGAAH